MTKRILVVIGDRAEEALRMALGLTLADDTVEVCLTAPRGGEGAEHLELLRDIEVPVWTTDQANSDLPLVARDDMARRLAEFDHVIPY
jgi:hypothetical protein